MSKTLSAVWPDLASSNALSIAVVLVIAASYRIQAAEPKRPIFIHSRQ
jgi:hypothetical protein